LSASESESPVKKKRKSRKVYPAQIEVESDSGKYSFTFPKMVNYA